MSGALVAVNGTRLHCERAGEGSPLVMIHGDALDARLWDGQFAFFAREREVLRYDVRGFGRSDPPGAEAYADVDDLKALLEYFDIDSAHLLGLSMGGRIATDFALTYPDSVGALVLLDSGLGGYPWSVEIREFFAAIFAAAREQDVEAARALWSQAPGHETIFAHSEAAVLFRRMVADYSGWFWLNEDPGTELAPPAFARLEEIQAPTLVLVGELDNGDCRTIADELYRRIPGAEKKVLPGVGHMSNLEAPEQLNQLVREFLSRHNA